MNNWNKYLTVLFERLYGFIVNPVIVIYFVCIVVIVGSFGVWYSAFDFPYCSANFFTDNSTITNLATYIISILAATMAHFLLSKKKRGTGFKIFSFSLFLLGFISAVISLIKFNWVFGYLSLVLTYILWMIVFSDDETLQSDDDNASGGRNPDRQNLPGTLANFKS